MEAPEGNRVSVVMGEKAAQQLAYYKAAQGPGVFAPRGWYCFGTYGSGGDSLLVSPEPIDTAHLFSTEWAGLSGPAIDLRYNFGGTSGRFEVVEVISRVFPAYRGIPLVKRVAKEMKDFDPPEDPLRFGPYPTDKLTYKSARAVEYQTLGEADGLGTHSTLEKNGDSIDGVAVLVGDDPDLLLLAVRLPPALSTLSSGIIGQVERDAARHPHGFD
ncbi:MAG: hypothetical protein ABSC23_05355 [Bryobacteraceae bacterium]